MNQETKSTTKNIETLLSCIWKNINSIAVDAARAFGGLAIALTPSTITINDLTTTTKKSISYSYHPIGIDVHGFIIMFMVLNLLIKKSTF
jgi:hypothetical protein